MRAIGLVTKQRDSVSILIWMVLNIRVNGRKISNMVKVKSLGQMGLCMKGIMLWVKSTELVNFYGQIIQSTWVNSRTIILRARVSINGLMEEYLTVYGKIIKCMGKVCSHGLIIEDMRESILKIKNRVTEHFFGLMEGNI